MLFSVPASIRASTKCLVLLFVFRRLYDLVAALVTPRARLLKISVHAVGAMGVLGWNSFGVAALDAKNLAILGDVASGDEL